MGASCPHGKQRPQGLCVQVCRVWFLTCALCARISACACASVCVYVCVCARARARMYLEASCSSCRSRPCGRLTLSPQHHTSHAQSAILAAHHTIAPAEKVRRPAPAASPSRYSSTQDKAAVCGSARRGPQVVCAPAGCCLSGGGGHGGRSACLLARARR